MASSDSAPRRRALWLRGSDHAAVAHALLAGRDAFDPLLIIVPNAASERALRERLAQGRALLGVSIRTAEQLARDLTGGATAPGLRVPAGGERLLARRLLDETGTARDWPRSAGFLGTLAGALRDLFDAGMTAAELGALRARRALDPRLLDLAERGLALRAELELADDTEHFRRALERVQAGAGPTGRIALVGLYDPTGLQEALVTALLTRADEALVALPGAAFSAAFEARLEAALRDAGHVIQHQGIGSFAPDGAAAEQGSALARWRATWLHPDAPGSAIETASDDSLGVLAVPGGQLGARLVARHIAGLLDRTPNLAPADIETVTRGTGGVPQLHLERELLALGVPVRRSRIGTDRAELEATLGRTALGMALRQLVDLLAVPKVPRARLLDMIQTWPWPVEAVDFGGEPAIERVVDVAERARWERLSAATGLRTVVDAGDSSRDAFRLLRRAGAGEQDEAAARALSAWIDVIADLRRRAGRMSLGELGRALAGLLERFADSSTQGCAEWQARLLSVGRFEVLLGSVDQESAGTGGVVEALSWLLDGFAREGLEAETLDPGGIRIGRLGTRRGARARVVYLLDGDADSFPRKRPVPVLLTDRERRMAAETLPSLASALAHEAEERALFQELLELAGERLVLVSTTVGIEGGAAVPSPFVLETLGFLAGDRERSRPRSEDVHSASAAPKGVECVPMQLAWSDLGGAAAAASSHEAALWCLDAVRARGAASVDVFGELVEAAVPERIARAARVEAARLLTPGRSAFDGQLGTDVRTALAEAGLVRGHSERGVSASTLESYATCGMRALLAKLLGVRAVDAPELGRGIVHTERGKRVHTILEEFTRAALAAGLDAWTPEVHPTLAPLLDAALTAELERARRASPDDQAPLWDAEEQRYRGLLGTWLRAQCRSDEQTPWRVRAPELGFGDRAGRGPEATPPVRIELADGPTLHLTGQIDRLDVLASADPAGAPAAVRVVDYKTGKPKGKDDETGGGTSLQLFLYGRVARRLMGAGTSEGAYDFVFGGERRRWSGAADDLAARELGVLVEHAEAGAFWPSPREGSKPSDLPCTYCDMAQACGPWRAEALRHVQAVDPIPGALQAAREEAKA